MIDFMKAIFAGAKKEAISLDTTAAAAVVDVKTLVANRLGDVVIAVIVMASIWLGHVL